MSRIATSQFQSEPLDDLARQLLRGPDKQRAEQLRRAEQLHDQIEPQQNYPLAFIVYRITHYRTPETRDTILAGQAVRDDLRRMIDLLSRSLELTADADGPDAMLVSTLAQQENISTKTIQRWRRLGLRWRWMRPAEGKKRQVYITPDAWRDFQKRFADKVQFATGFSQMSDADRQQLLARARRIAEHADVSLNRVADHLARKSGRALETLRQLLEKHDREHPDDPIFADRTGPLTPHQHRVIDRAYHKGVPMRKICRHFKRTRATILRVVHLQRAERARRLDIHYIDSPLFEREDADEVLLLRPEPPDPISDETAAAARSRRRLRDTTTPKRVPVDDLPEPLQAIYDQPTMPDERQRSLLIRYNYLKFKASRIREQFDPVHPRAADLDAFDMAWRQAQDIRLQLIRANLPIVLSVARRQLIGSDDPSHARLMPLLEIGHVELFEVLESYNPKLKIQFSSVLTNRLLGRYAREAADVADKPAHAIRRIPPTQMLARMQRTATAYGVPLNQLMHST